MLLRFTYEDVKGTWPKNQDTMLQNGSVENVIRMDNRTQKKVTQMADRTPERNIHNSRFREALEAHENILKSEV
jgi:hypothetical protein